MAKKQQLNSLDRFRKQPGRLVLEEHSHCEVPAGCGGVVLRWRNPQAAVPVTFYLYTPVEAMLYLDGAELPATRLDLTPGRHVVGVSVANVVLSSGLLLFAAVHSKSDVHHRSEAPAQVIEHFSKVVSAADGTWKFTLEEPADEEWKALDFDDRDWPALTKHPTPRVDYTDFGAYARSECVRHGAVCLGIPDIPDFSDQEGEEKRLAWWQKLLGRRVEPSGLPDAEVGNIWIRKIFDIPAPEQL